MNDRVLSLQLHIMKTHRILFLALIVSAAFAVSAQAGDRHKGNNNQAAYKSGGSSGAQVHSGAPRFAQRSSYSSTRRTFAPSPRMTTTRSMPTFSQHHVISGGNTSFVPQQFTRRTFNERTGNGLAHFQNNRPIQTNRFTEMHGHHGDAFSQLQGQHHNRTAQLGTGGRNRTIGNISPGHNHVFAQQSVGWNRSWDRRHDHWWNGHRCRWVNNSWFIFDIGFIPWFGWPYCDYYADDYYYPYGYGGYGYGTYGYDPGVYDQSNYYDQGGYSNNDQSNYYDQGSNRSGSYDESTAAMVADLQDKLTRAGYYHGQIDGVVGPETRHALVRYQSDKGLRVTGSLTTETQQSLGLAQGEGEVTSDQ